jgi:hypothetical protein
MADNEGKMDTEDGGQRKRLHSATGAELNADTANEQLLDVIKGRVAFFNSVQEFIEAGNTLTNCSLVGMGSYESKGDIRDAGLLEEPIEGVKTIERNRFGRAIKHTIFGFPVIEGLEFALYILASAHRRHSGAVVSTGEGCLYLPKFRIEEGILYTFNEKHQVYTGVGDEAAGLYSKGALKYISSTDTDLTQHITCARKLCTVLNKLVAAHKGKAEEPELDPPLKALLSADTALKMLQATHDVARLSGIPEAVRDFGSSLASTAIQMSTMDEKVQWALTQEDVVRALTVARFKGFAAIDARMVRMGGAALESKAVSELQADDSVVLGSTDCSAKLLPSFSPSTRVLVVPLGETLFVKSHKALPNVGAKATFYTVRGSNAILIANKAAAVALASTASASSSSSGGASATGSVPKGLFFSSK